MAESTPEYPPGPFLLKRSGYGGLCLVLGCVVAAGWGRGLVLEEREEENARHT